MSQRGSVCSRPVPQGEDDQETKYVTRKSADATKKRLIRKHEKIEHTDSTRNNTMGRREILEGALLDTTRKHKTHGTVVLDDLWKDIPA